MIMVLLSLLLWGSTCRRETRFNIYEPDEELQNADFWLSGIKDADKLILTKKQIKKINSKNYQKNLMIRPLQKKTLYTKREIKQFLKWDLAWIKHFKKYDKDGTPVNGTEFRKQMQELSALGSIKKKVSTKYCLVVKPTSLRAFPTDRIILRKPDDYPFDVIHVTYLDTGEVLTLLHTSADKKWGYGLSAYRRGWFRLSDAGWTYSKQEVQKFIQSSKFVMATGWEVPVYSSISFNRTRTVIHMGSKLPLVRDNAHHYIVKIPANRPDGKLKFRLGYIKKDDRVNMEYLKCTPNNVARQAFKMIGMPYTWGGFEYGTDCSSFIRRVFLTMGLNLPRNSLQQMKVLKKKSVRSRQPDQKQRVMNTLKPFQAILYYHTPSHVMLYAGKYNGGHYVIHNKWAFKKREGKEEKKVYIKQIVVTGLDLGKESSDKSLFSKISRISVLK